MPSLLESVLDFCDNFPILSIVVIIICTFASIPPIILLIALQRSAVHANCRFLISLWAICLCTIILNIAVLYGHMFTFNDGFIPRGVTYPPLRQYLFWLHGTLYFASSSFEMLVVSERILSTRQPHIYHESRRATKTIILAAAFSFALGIVNDYFLYMRGTESYNIGLYVHTALDLLNLVANFICIRYSSYRFDALYGNGSLNARYQVKETNLMAKAMHPVYFMSLLLKLSGSGIGYIYTIFICCSDVRYYVFLDFLYFTVHITNCVFSATFLIFKHASIRKAARNIFKKEIEPQRADIVDGARSHETTNAYFSMLGQSWR